MALALLAALCTMPFAAASAVCPRADARSGGCLAPSHDSTEGVMLQLASELQRRGKHDARPEVPVCRYAKMFDLCHHDLAKEACPESCGTCVFSEPCLDRPTALLQRAATKEAVTDSELASLLDTTLRWKSGNSARETFMNAKHEVDKVGIWAATATPSEKEFQRSPVDKAGMALPSDEQMQALTEGSVGDTPKVAFLFALMDGVDHEDVWDSFFDRAPPGRFSLYTHRAKESAVVVGGPLQKWGAIQVSTVNTTWCAVLGAQVKLVREALRDPLNAQFVFLSQSHMPLKNFGHVYSQLIQKTPETSKVCFASPADTNSAIWEGLKWEINAKCIYRDFYHLQNSKFTKHHQWVVFARRHADAFLRKAPAALEDYQTLWEASAPDVRNDGCSDEAVPANALLLDLADKGESTGSMWDDFDKLGVQQSCLTFVSWRNCLKGTNLSVTEEAFSLNTLSQILGAVVTGKSEDIWNLVGDHGLNGFPHRYGDVDVGYLQALTDEGFMFGRKFLKGSQVLLANGQRESFGSVLPKLWEQVQEEKAAARVWVRLDSKGSPMSEH